MPQGAGEPIGLQEGRQGGLEAVASRFDSLAVQLEAALIAHDDGRVAQALQNAPLPPTVKARLQEAVHRTASAEALQALVRREIDQTRQQVLQQLRRAFAEAIGRIYHYVLMLVVAGLVVT